MLGIDCSHWQASIDFNKVATAAPKIDFCFVHATTGLSLTDKKFLTNAKQVNATNIHFSYYHFARLNFNNGEPNAQPEAALFLSQIKKAPTPNLPLVLDFEENKVGATPAQCLAWVNQFIQILKDAGFPEVIIYSYQWFLDANLPANHGLGIHPLWIARYSTSPPILPKGWDKYLLWQYTNRGIVAGISTLVDLSKSDQPLF